MQPIYCRKIDQEILYFEDDATFHGFYNQMDDLRPKRVEDSRKGMKMRAHVKIVVAIFMVILITSCQITETETQPVRTSLPAKISTQTDVPVLTETPTRLYPPALGASGVIAYCYQPPSSGIHQIYTINPDGSHNQKLIDAPIGLNHLDWSPNGQRLAVVGYISDETWSIHVFDIATSNLTRLTYLEGVWDSDPSWSPDGSKIAFTRTYPEQNGRNEIWIMDSDGGHSYSVGIDGFAPDWSPDGMRLVYIANKSGNYEIYTSGVDGADERQLTTTPDTNETFAAWSPDGNQIAFSASTGEWGTEKNLKTYEIYLMNADGTGTQPLTDNQAYDDHPRWSPDGTRIVFESDLDQSGHWEIYTVNVDGTNLRRLTNTPDNATAINPAWQPSAAPALTPTAFVANFTPTADSRLLIDPFLVSDQKFGDGRTFSLAPGDLDRDGDLDVLVANYRFASEVWVNLGGRQGGLPGTYSSGQDIGSSTGHGIALGDLDGDSDLDAFVVHNASFDQVWLNDGAGNLMDSGQQLGRAEDATTSVSLADVDNDGDLDAFTIHYQKPVRLWVNDGSGVFTGADVDLGTNALSVALSDVDLDGDLDALIAYIEKPNQLWLNDGMGTFTDSGQRLGSEEGWGNATFGDVDKDGYLDAILASTSGGTIEINDGMGNFTDSGQKLDKAPYITVGDIDNDDDLDAITCSELWLNNGIGIFSILSLSNKVQGCSGVWLGDADGDGDLDAFVGSYERSNELWLNTTFK